MSQLIRRVETSTPWDAFAGEVLRDLIEPVRCHPAQEGYVVAELGVDSIHWPRHRRRPVQIQGASGSVYEMVAGARFVNIRRRRLLRRAA